MRTSEKRTSEIRTNQGPGVGTFEVRVRVRKKIRQNAHVRAKCVRGNISMCEVRACEVKYIAPNILTVSREEKW